LFFLLAFLLSEKLIDKLLKIHTLSEMNYQAAKRGRPISTDAIADIELQARREAARFRKQASRSKKDAATPAQSIQEQTIVERTPMSHDEPLPTLAQLGLRIQDLTLPGDYEAARSQDGSVPVQDNGQWIEYALSRKASETRDPDRTARNDLPQLSTNAGTRNMTHYYRTLPKPNPVVQYDNRGLGNIRVPHTPVPTSQTVNQAELQPTTVAERHPAAPIIEEVCCLRPSGHPSPCQIRLTMRDSGRCHDDNTRRYCRVPGGR
jgi:hypothetical protein